MAQNVLSPLNLNKLELQNPRLHFLTTGTAPASPVEGQVYYASDTHQPYVWNNSAWIPMVTTTTFAAPAFVLTTAAAAGVATTAVRSDASIALFDATAPTTSAVGDAAAVGSQAFAARRDHTHGREAFATNTIALGTAATAGAATTHIRPDATIAAFDVTAPTTSAVGDAAAVGSAAFAARRDHVHGREAFATPAIVLGTAAAAGAATTHIRSDATIVAFDGTAPTTSGVGDAAAVGSAAVSARRDHVHGREAFGAVTAQTAFGAASANGAASTEARSDHNHGTPTHLTADHSAVAISGLAVPTADVPWNSHKITGLLDPTASQDAATKNYVDATAQGLSPKASVKLATTAILPGTYTYANGAAGVGATLTAPGVGILTIDGVATVLADRILVKNEATAANNGIYAVTTAGTAGVAAILTRGVEEDAASKVPGAFVFVEAGTANTATGWVIANAGPFTVGTTAQNFTQFSGAGTYLGTAGQITLTGSTFSIAATYVGQSSIVTLGTITTGVWTGTTIAVANGGTGQTTAALARGTGGVGSATAPTAGTGDVSRAAGGIPTKATFVIGDGATTSVVLNHNLNTRDVVVSCYRASSPWDVVIVETDITTVNQITLVFAVAPTASQFNVVVMG